MFRFLALLALSGLTVAPDQVARAATLDAAGLAGDYELRGVHEMGSGLRLQPDGRFQYFLVYGALDMIGEGRWTVEGDRVLLTSDPAVVPPRFELRSSRKTNAHELRVRVVDEKGAPVDRIDVKIAYDRGDPEISETDDGYVALPLDDRQPRAVTLGIEVYGFETTPFPINIDIADDLTFVFRPNDLGKVDFRAQPLTLSEDGALLMSPPDRKRAPMRYVRVGKAR